jgi:hypothetical protein
MWSDQAMTVSFSPIRRCRQYLRLMDPSTRVWFHALEEDSMTPTTATHEHREQAANQHAMRMCRDRIALHLRCGTGVLTERDVLK